MDNPSAYMFLQDNIGFGKPPHIGRGRRGGQFTVKMYVWYNDSIFKQQFHSAFDDGRTYPSSFLITAGLLNALF